MLHILDTECVVMPQGIGCAQKQMYCNIMPKSLSKIGKRRDVDYEVDCNVDHERFSNLKSKVAHTATQSQQNN
jgi:hypothetical protein